MREQLPGDRLTRGSEHHLLGLLGCTPVFSALTPAERAQAAQAAVFEHYEKGDVIAHHGQVWRKALLVVDGTLRMVKGSASGRILAAVLLRSGDLFLSHSMFDDGPVPASLEAETRTSCVVWEAQALNRLIRENPSALWAVSQVHVSLMRRASDVIDTLAFQPLSGRLARLILDSCGEDDWERVPRTLTLDDMAARLNTTREVVCRLLYRLADDGLLRISRTEFSFIDRQRLTELADRGSPGGVQ